MTLQLTPLERGICEENAIRRLLGCILSAMALADSPATLDRLMDAHFAASLRLEQAQSIPLKG